MTFTIRSFIHVFVRLRVCTSNLASDTGTANVLQYDKLAPDFNFTPRGDGVVTASLRVYVGSNPIQPNPRRRVTWYFVVVVVVVVCCLLLFARLVWGYQVCCFALLGSTHNAKCFRST